MASNFPEIGIDSFVSKVDGVDYPTAAHVNDLQNAVVTVQTKVGLDSSADNDSLDYKIANMWSTVYPVGCIYQSVVSTSPATLFGGTWSAFGTGRVLVAIDAGQAGFDTVEETGGAATHTLSSAESGVPAHTHTINANYTDLTSHQHRNNTTYVATGMEAADQSGVAGDSTSDENATASASSAHNNLQPYIVIYRWKRTA